MKLKTISLDFPARYFLIYPRSKTKQSKTNQNIKCRLSLENTLFSKTLGKGMSSATYPNNKGMDPNPIRVREILSTN